MTYPFARLASKWIDTPLMIEPSKAVTIANAFAPRVLGGAVNVLGDMEQPVVEAGILRERLRDHYDRHETLHRTDGGVAVIEVEGTLVDKGAFLGASSGETSYEGLSVQVADAHDDSIKAVVFEFDSPGGMVDGCFELADEIFELSKVKPTVAILTSCAASAAYLLASACGSIVVPRFGVVGSIGVITMHVDARRAAEDQGFDVTVFRSGLKKADGHPLVEPRDGWSEEMQDRLDRMRDAFAETVARYRAGSISKESALATEAGVYEGQDAVDAGLADAVADPKKAFRAFVEQYG